MNKLFKALLTGFIIFGLSSSVFAVRDDRSGSGGNEGNYVRLQSTSPGTQQRGNTNINGNSLIAGCVGIGTTSPSAALDVVGNVEITGNVEVNAVVPNNVSIMGNLGVGTTAPTTNLEVINTTPGQQIMRLRRNNAFDCVQSYLTAASGSGVLGWNDWTTEAGRTRGTSQGDIIGVIGDSFYIGDAAQFTSVYVDVSTAKSTGGTFVYEYSQGSDTWATLTTMSDGTSVFTNDGVMTFTAPVDWATDTQNGVTAYWIRVRVTAGTFSTEPTIYLTVKGNATGVLQFAGNENDTETSQFYIDENGYINLINVNTFTALGTITATTFSGNLSGSSATLSSSTGFTYTLGLSSGTSSTYISATAPVMNSSVVRFLSEAWNSSSAVTNSMDMAVLPTGVGTTATGANLIIRNSTLNDSATVAPAAQTIGVISSTGNFDLLGTTLGAEVFTDSTMDTGATNWTSTGDFAYTTNDYTYTHNTGAGTLSQSSAKYATAMKANTWYKFSFVNDVAPTNAQAPYIGTEVATENIYFTTLTTEVDVYFKTNAAPGSFTVYATSTATSGWRISSWSLKEVSGGNFASYGLFTGGGTLGLKVSTLGNVGIGTTAPVTYLQVNQTPGALYATPTISLGDGDSGLYESADDTIMMALAGSVYYGFSASALYDNQSSSGFYLKRGNISGTVPTYTINGDTDTGMGSAAANILSLIAGGTNSLNIISTGNVGLGTTNPTYSLQIDGVTGATTEGLLIVNSPDGANMFFRKKTGVSNTLQIGTATNNAIEFLTNNTEVVRFTSLGNVGIGTTNPTSILTLQGSTGIRVMEPTSTTYTELQHTANVGSLIVYSSSRPLVLGTNSVEKMRIDTTGNVGIGTTNPAYKLDVSAPGAGIISRSTSNAQLTVANATGGNNWNIASAGTGWSAGAGNFAIWQGSSSLFIINSLGNVGIGTTNPTEKLHIVGNAFIDTDSNKLYLGAGKDMGLYYDGTAGNIDTDLVAASDLTIDCGTLKTLVLEVPVYDELMSTPIVATKPGSTAPTLATFVGNIEQYTFDATNDYVIGSVEVPHWYKEGTDLHPHVHWATNGTEAVATGVKWQLEYDWANMNSVGVGSTFPSSTVTISAETAIPANTPDRTHMYTDLTDITGTNIDVGAVLVYKFSRIAAGVGTTAPAADPFGLQVGFHAQKDTLGSRNEVTK